MNGTRKDDGSIVFDDGKLKKKENIHVNIGNLNDVMQRMFVFFTTLGWACNGYLVQDFWTARADQVVRSTLQSLVWQKFGDKHQSLGHIINCWKQLLMYLAEKLQNGDTLAEAWMNCNWESKWAFYNHTAYSLQGSGADKPLSRGEIVFFTKH